MGLDMFLKADRYLSSYDEIDAANQGNIKNLFPEIKENAEDSGITIRFTIGYWRKANHIHNWFVENIQEGNDDCGEYWIPTEQLENLKESCSKVIESLEKSKVIVDSNGNEVFKDSDLALELLPPSPGFFFGSYEIDKYYLDDLRDTVRIIDKCLLLKNEYDFYYRASW